MHQGPSHKNDKVTKRKIKGEPPRNSLRGGTILNIPGIKNWSAEDIPTHHVQKVYAARQALLHKLFGHGGGVSIVSVRGI